MKTENRTKRKIEKILTHRKPSMSEKFLAPVNDEMVEYEQEANYLLDLNIDKEINNLAKIQLLKIGFLRSSIEYIINVERRLQLEVIEKFFKDRCDLLKNDVEDFKFYSLNLIKKLQKEADLSDDPFSRGFRQNFVDFNQGMMEYLLRYRALLAEIMANALEIKHELGNDNIHSV